MSNLIGPKYAGNATKGRKRLKGRWFEIRTRWGMLSWQIGNATSGGFKRGPYRSWSYACKFGCAMWTGWVSKKL